MTGPERQIDDRLADWVDGTLSERDRDRFVAELRVNPQLRQDLADYEKTVATVRAALQAPVTSTNLTDRVLAAIAAEQQAKATPASRVRLPAFAWRPSGWRPVAWSVASAAAVLCVALLVNAWSPTRTTVTTAQSDATLDEILAGKARSPGDGVLEAELPDAGKARTSRLKGGVERQDAERKTDAGRDADGSDGKAASVRELGRVEGVEGAPARTEQLDARKAPPLEQSGAPGDAAGKDARAPVLAPSAEVDKSEPSADDRRPAAVPSASAPADDALREALVPEPERSGRREPAGDPAPGSPRPGLSKNAPDGQKPGSLEGGANTAPSLPAGSAASRARGAARRELLPLVVLQGDAITTGLEAKRAGLESGAKSQSAEKAKGVAGEPGLDEQLDAFFISQMRFDAARSEALQLPVLLPSLRFHAVPLSESPATGGSTVPPPAAAGSSARPSPARDPSGQDATERTWLVEGSKEEVAVLLRRLGAFANACHLSLRTGETQETPPAVVERIETANPDTGVPTDRVAPDQGAGDERLGGTFGATTAGPAPTRIVLRFRVLRR